MNTLDKHCLENKRGQKLLIAISSTFFDRMARFLAWWLIFSRSTPIFSEIEDWRSFEVTWPRNWRSFQNVLTYTNGVSFPRFFGVENPNLGSNWWLEVNWGHWRRPMTSIDLQNGGHFRIQPLTHVGCLFLGFLGWRIRIWGRIDD